MEKKTFLAIALSLLVLLSWSQFVSKTQHLDNQEVTTKMPPPIADVPLKLSPPVNEPAPVTSKPLVFNGKEWDLVFNEATGGIQEVIFKKYLMHKLFLKNGLVLDLPGLQFRKAEEGAPGKITFIGSDGNSQITQRYSAFNSNYTIELETEILNTSTFPLSLNAPLFLGTLDFSPANKEANYLDVAISTKEKIWHNNGRKEVQIADLQFMGLRTRYFCILIEPKYSGYSGFVQKLNNTESRVGITGKEIKLAPGEKTILNYAIYLGPQDVKILANIKPSWALLVNYGTFDFISQLLLQLLNFLYQFVHNWGWTIIALSFIIYILLYPLTLKQMRSMKEMQLLQPKIEELRKLYKDNPQKLNKEILELYREHKVNPLGGCLPLILQIPIFFALYQAFLRFVPLKGASFLWIKDLSEPDRLFLLPFSLPFLGNEVNILPILMAIIMFLQQKITTVSSVGSSAEQQKMMLILFPIMFGFLFYHISSGLVLYWFMNSLFMFAYQLRVMKRREK